MCCKNKTERFFALHYFLCAIFTIILLGGCATLFSEEQQTKETQGDTLFLQAQRFFEYGQFQQAIYIWEQILPSDPQYLDAQLGIRSARLKIEQIKEQQIASSQRILKTDTYISEANQLEQRGDLAGALQKYEEARLLDPKNVYLYNKIEELHALLDDTLERYARLGDIYLAQGEFEKSKAEWERLLLLNPANEKAKQRLADIEVLTATSDTVFVTRGRSLLEKGLVNAAKTEFEKARRVNPANDFTATYLTKLENIDFTEYAVKKGDTLSSIAQTYSGNPSDFRTLADFNNLDPNVALRIGQPLKIPHILGFKNSLSPEGDDILLQSSSETTEPTSSRNLERPETPENTVDTEALENTMNNGITAFRNGRYREAVTLLQQVLLQDPDNEQAYEYFVRAADYVRRGATTVATTPSEPLEGERDAPEIEPPSETDVLFQTAMTYREAGNLKKAIETFEQAYQLAPENSSVVENLEATRDELKKLITAYLNEGIKYFNQDALEAAILEWDKVLELDPSNRQAAEYKKRAETMLNTLAQ